MQTRQAMYKIHRT